MIQLIGTGVIHVNPLFYMQESVTEHHSHE